jgi:hypothetical protein
MLGNGLRADGGEDRRDLTHDRVGRYRAAESAFSSARVAGRSTPASTRPYLRFVWLTATADHTAATPTPTTIAGTRFSGKVPSWYQSVAANTPAHSTLSATNTSTRTHNGASDTRIHMVDFFFRSGLRSWQRSTG